MKCDCGAAAVNSTMHSDWCSSLIEWPTLELDEHFYNSLEEPKNLLINPGLETGSYNWGSKTAVAHLTHQSLQSQIKHAYYSIPGDINPDNFISPYYVIDGYVPRQLPPMTDLSSVEALKEIKEEMHRLYNEIYKNMIVFGECKIKLTWEDK